MHRTVTALCLTQVLAFAPVCFAQDTTPPVLLDFQVNTPSVDISSGAGTLEFAGTATDDLSGVLRAVISYMRSDGVFIVAGNTYVFDPSGNFTITTTIPEFSPTGTYTVNRIELTDFVSNQSSWDTAGLQALGLPTTFEVLGALVDTTPPVLLDFQVNTPSVDISSGAGTLEFAGTATDDLSGVLRAVISYMRSDGVFIVAGNTYVFDSSGNFTITTTIPELSPTGIYTVNRVELTDFVSNQSSWDTAGLQALGFPTTFEVVAGPTLACTGFYPPLDSGPVSIRGRNRALPLRAQLFDDGGLPITELDIPAPPVIQVMFNAAAGGDPVDVTSEVLPADQATDGNQFFFDDDGYWHLNFKTKDYTAPGTYLLFMDTGDSSEYLIDPTCYAEFIRE